MASSATKQTNRQGKKALGSGDRPRAKEYRGRAETKEGLLQSIQDITDMIEFSYPVKIVIEPETILDDLFWNWMRELSENLKRRWPNAYSSLDRDGLVMHDLVCSLFMGKTKPRKLGRTLVEGRQKTWDSPALNRSEKFAMLKQVEKWAMGFGVALPVTSDEYRKGLTNAR